MGLVLISSFFTGYAWGDERRNRGIIMVTGWQKTAVIQAAEHLARLFWDAHDKFEYVAPVDSFEECINTALASKKRPYYISDSGDNPTAGGSGDVTWTLERLLKRAEFKDTTSPTVIYASIPGPEAVRIATEAGVGSTVTVTAGAEVDNIHSGPVSLTGRVHALRAGDKHAVQEAVIQVGSVFVIITKLRKPYHYEHDFVNLNLDPRAGADIVIVKIGYLQPELFEMSVGWIMALTPGGVNQDLEALEHRHIRRPMWPFDKDFEREPDLRARILPLSHEDLTGEDI